MVFSDRSIREALDSGRIVIDPRDDSCIQPSSVDLHVDRYFRLFRNHTSRVIDVREDQEDLTELVDIGEDLPLILHPGEFVLGSTLEKVQLPDDLVARLEGKSSLGRLGLLIHSTAGFVDAGWDGHLTLELSNVANLPITVYPGMKIGQISFIKMTTSADHPYGSGDLGSKYQHQRGPTPSRYFENFRDNPRGRPADRGCRRGSPPSRSAGGWFALRRIGPVRARGGGGAASPSWTASQLRRTDMSLSYCGNRP